MKTQTRPMYLVPESGDTLLARFLAPLFPRYRTLLALEAEPPHLRGPYRNMILTADHRLLFLRNQKCACTQTTQLLYAYCNQGQTYRGNVHRANKGILPARYRWAEVKPVYEAHTPFLFTFVRHPRARALSAYRDFFVDLTNGARQKHMKPMLARGYDPKGDATRNLDVFLDYVQECLSENRVLTDSHWRLQIDNIAFDDIVYDFIGRVENYDHDIHHAFEGAGIRNFLTEAMLAHKHNATRKSDLVVTPAQDARIEQIWASDYQAFGY